MVVAGISKGSQFYTIIYIHPMTLIETIENKHRVKYFPEYFNKLFQIKCFLTFIFLKRT